MPYIKQEDREKFEGIHHAIVNETEINSPGELNYLFTLLANQYLEDNGKNYQNINDVVGALEGCKMEFYRRVAAPYEDKKIEENGDVNYA